MDTSPSAAALNAWCDAERGRAARLAEALDVSAATINYYRRGVIVPNAKPEDDKRRAIEEHTDGAVLASGWVVEETPADDAPATIPDARAA